MATEALNTVVVAEFNVGWSNKAKTLQWNELADDLANCDVGIAGLTEVSNKDKTLKFASRLGAQIGDDKNRFDTVIYKIGYDYAALLYDTKRFRMPDLQVEVSEYGKYLRVEMERVDDGAQFDATVSHLPKRKNRQRACNLLSKATQRSNVASLYVGDYNASPDSLPRDIPAIVARVAQRAFESDATAPPTTEGGNAFDNFYSVGANYPVGTKRGYVGRRAQQQQHLSRPEVLDSLYGSDHRPIVADWDFHPTT